MSELANWIQILISIPIAMGITVATCFATFGLLYITVVPACRFIERYLNDTWIGRFIV